MIRRAYFCSRLGFSLAALIAAASSAFAQTASQITPKSFAPPIESGLGGGLAVGASPGLDTPPGAEKLFVKLRDVEVDGGFPGLAGAAADIRAKLMGKQVSGADIFAAARALEAAYANAGYVLVRVTLPPQKLVNGSKLRLVVVDGFIERIEVKDVPERVRQHIASLLAPLTGQRGLMLHDLERRILLAGDVPGVILRSALAAGTQPGATVLVIDAKYQPLQGTLSADNSLANSLGRYQVSIGENFNSVFGFGELAYIRATGDPAAGTNGVLSDYPRNRILAAGFILPIGIDGMTFNAEGTQARTAPASTTAFQSTDQFERLSLRLRYPWLRARDYNFATQIAFDAQDEQQSILAQPTSLPLSLDRLRIIRVTNEGNYLSSWGGTFSGSLTASFGLDALGARTAADASPILPLSRQGADATFSKLDGTLGYSQSLAEHLTTSLSAHAQTAFGSVMEHAEQIGIAGPGFLSAFDTGTLQGDSGAVVRGELASPFVLPANFFPAGATDVGIVAAPYVFGALGEVFFQNPTVLEPSHVRAASYGAGLRFNGARAGTLSNGSLTLEFARQARSDGQPLDNRLNLVSTINF